LNAFGHPAPRRNIARSACFGRYWLLGRPGADDFGFCGNVPAEAFHTVRATPARPIGGVPTRAEAAMEALHALLEGEGGIPYQPNANLSAASAADRADNTMFVSIDSS
jgi:hypothetical protein